VAAPRDLFRAVGVTQTAALIVLAAVLAACGGEGVDSRESSASRDGRSADPADRITSADDRRPEHTPDDATRRQRSNAQGPRPVGEGQASARSGGDFPSAGVAVAHLVDVRVASHGETDEHPPFDRVVLEFEGDSRPSWRVAYTEPPIRQDGSGHEVDVSGDAFLELRLAPASGVDLQGPELRRTYKGPDRLGLDGAAVKEIVRTGDFEAHLSWVIGAERTAPFAVEWLDDPIRLVVDVFGEDE
jgi:hypothetical protein